MAILSPSLSSLYERLEGSSSETLSPEMASAWLMRLRPKLLSMAHDLMGPELRAKVGASDIVQQTYMDAIGNLQRSKIGKKRQLLGWIKVLLKNNVRDAVRAFKGARKRQMDRECQFEEAHLPGRTHGPSERLVNEEQYERILSCIARLPEPHQQVLHWRYFDDLTYAEIAQRVSRREDAVRMMVQRCLSRIREELDECSRTGCDQIVTRTC